MGGWVAEPMVVGFFVQWLPPNPACFKAVGGWGGMHPLRPALEVLH